MKLSKQDRLHVTHDVWGSYEGPDDGVTASRKRINEMWDKV